MKLAVRYGKGAESKHVQARRGTRRLGGAAQEPVLVSDVSKDPRYINLVDDARSELVIPMLIKDRCIGVFDLESPELDAFTKEHKELLTLLASQAAVAIDNARLYEEVRRNEERIEKELRFAQRVQVALLPTELPRPLDDVDVAGTHSSRRASSEATSTTSSRPTRARWSSPSATCRARARRRRSTARFAAELVRSRTMRRRFTPDRFSVSGVLQAMNTILHERQLEEYYCTLCYAFFDFERRVGDAVQLRAAVSDPLHAADAARRSSCQACRSGRSRA